MYLKNLISINLYIGTSICVENVTQLGQLHTLKI